MVKAEFEIDEQILRLERKIEEIKLELTTLKKTLDLCVSSNLVEIRNVLNLNASIEKCISDE